MMFDLTYNQPNRRDPDRDYAMRHKERAEGAAASKKAAKKRKKAKQSKRANR